MFSTRTSQSRLPPNIGLVVENGFRENRVDRIRECKTDAEYSVGRAVQHHWDGVTVNFHDVSWLQCRCVRAAIQTQPSPDQPSFASCHSISTKQHVQHGKLSSRRLMCGLRCLLRPVAVYRPPVLDLIAPFESVYLYFPTVSAGPPTGVSLCLSAAEGRFAPGPQQQAGTGEEKRTLR